MTPVQHYGWLVRAAVKLDLALGRLAFPRHDARVTFAVLNHFRAKLVLTVALCTAAACKGDPPYCHTGICVCSSPEECTFTCDKPPCAVDCQGNNALCVGACGNGFCACGPMSNCQFACAVPPCNVSCASDTTCIGFCANGSCTCASGSECDFYCDSAPCRVDCEGKNESCHGVCASDTCHCGKGSTCDFECADGNCSVECDSGASCLLHCPAGNAGDGCDFSECSSPTVCPDGFAVACNAECPEPVSEE